jgi:dihydrofolate reductase
MGKVFLDMVISLDGFIAGPNDEGKGLHNWYFSPSGNAIKILDELQKSVGAMILGKRTFDIGDAQGGFADSPYKVPHFVLTHEPRPSMNKGGVVFTFVDGIDNALEQAKAAAGDKDICIAGGARVAQQYLKAGLVDELQVHIAPLLMGEGIRLFEHLRADGTKLERLRVLESPAATHLRYRITKEHGNA